MGEAEVRVCLLSSLVVWSFGRSVGYYRVDLERNWESGHPCFSGVEVDSGQMDSYMWVTYEIPVSRLC